MNVRTMLMTAAVSLALTGLAGCGQDETTTTSRAPDTTVTTPPATTPTPPAATTTPPADTTAAAPATSTTTAATGSGPSDVDRSAGQTVDDATVTAKVKAALLAESGVAGTKINVDTFQGRVTLKGEVPSKNMADRAVQVARGIEGVKDVDNRLSAGAG
jgi:hyperosmotically inducible periplasmic protein